MLGLLLYMRGLAVGPMGVVAPLSAVVGAGLPLVAGVLGGERPGVVGWLGGGRRTGGDRTGERRAAVATPRPVPGCCYGLGAGVGFGLFFVAWTRRRDGSGLWPLVAGRAVSVTLLALVFLSPAGGARCTGWG